MEADEDPLARKQDLNDCHKTCHHQPGAVRHYSRVQARYHPGADRL